MPRLSAIDKMPDDISAEISRLRRAGATMEQIRAKLAELLPGDIALPSRSAVSRHIRKIDILGARIRANRDIANEVLERLGDRAESRLTRLNAELLQSALTALMVGEDGEPATLSAQEAGLLASALQRIASAAKTDAETTARIREEQRREMAQKLDDATRDGFNAKAAEEARRILGFSA